MARCPEKRGRSRSGSIVYRCLLGACALVLVPQPARALELSGGVSMGAILAGTQPHLAVSPHAGMSWRTEGGALFAIHDLCSILPATNEDGVGIYNQTSAAIGYATDKGNFSVGPSFTIYSMPACSKESCGRVTGLSPGGHAQANVYIAGPLGVSVSAGVDWVGGISRALPGGVAAMVVIGPVFRWSAE